MLLQTLVADFLHKKKKKNVHKKTLSKMRISSMASTFRSYYFKFVNILLEFT